MDLPVSIVRDADASRFCNTFKPGGNVYAVAKDIIAFDEHIAHIDADAKQHLPMGRESGVPFRHDLLDCRRALDGGHNGREIKQDAVAGGLDDPAAMAGHNRGDGSPVF